MSWVSSRGMSLSKTTSTWIRDIVGERRNGLPQLSSAFRSDTHRRRRWNEFAHRDRRISKAHLKKAVVKLWWFDLWSQDRRSCQSASCYVPFPFGTTFRLCRSRPARHPVDQDKSKVCKRFGIITKWKTHCVARIAQANATRLETQSFRWSIANSEIDGSFLNLWDKMFSKATSLTAGKWAQEWTWQPPSPPWCQS